MSSVLVKNISFFMVGPNDLIRNYKVQFILDFLCIVTYTIPADW